MGRLPRFLAPAAAGVLAAATLYVFRARIHAALDGPVYDPFAFRLSRLEGARPASPTALQFGPDGKLYVATRFGLIHRYTVAREQGRFRVTHTETTGTIAGIPNHDDHGRAQPAVTGRLIAGLLVTGPAEDPRIYVSSSDPRIEDAAIDTNSGIVSMLRKAGGQWARTDLVRGLPRSRFDHAPLGLALDPATKGLLLSVGSNTNAGAPSSRFLGLPEYELSASLLLIDLGRIGARTYDLPTRAGSPAPFGGRGGANQALLDEDGPVRLHATGIRNAFDLIALPDGVITADNGANAGSGGPPRPGASAGTLSEGGASGSNVLHWIPGPGFDFGHPNPAARLRFPRPPRSAIATFPQSTNGLALLEPGTGEGPVRLLAASLNCGVYLVRIDRARPAAASIEPVVGNIGAMPLDVWAQRRGEAFEGSIWIAQMGLDAIDVLDPVDASPAAWVSASAVAARQNLRAAYEWTRRSVHAVRHGAAVAANECSPSILGEVSYR